MHEKKNETIRSGLVCLFAESLFLKTREKEKPGGRKRERKRGVKGKRGKTLVTFGAKDTQTL